MMTSLQNCTIRANFITRVVFVTHENIMRTNLHDSIVTLLQDCHALQACAGNSREHENSQNDSSNADLDDLPRVCKILCNNRRRLRWIKLKLKIQHCCEASTKGKIYISKQSSHIEIEQFYASALALLQTDTTSKEPETRIASHTIGISNLCRIPFKATHIKLSIISSMT